VGQHEPGKADAGQALAAQHTQAIADKARAASGGEDRSGVRRNVPGAEDGT